MTAFSDVGSTSLRLSQPITGPPPSQIAGTGWHSCILLSVDRRRGLALSTRQGVLTTIFLFLIFLCQCLFRRSTIGSRQIPMAWEWWNHLHPLKILPVTLVRIWLLHYSFLDKLWQMTKFHQDQMKIIKVSPSNLFWGWLGLSKFYHWGKFHLSDHKKAP